MTRIPPDEPSFDPATWSGEDAARHLADGVRLFNLGEYEEAHELFEKLWLSTQGADSDFFKGLVQAAVALLHFERQNLEGAAKLHAGCRGLFAAYLPAHLGIDVAAFLRDMQTTFGPVARRAAGSEPRFDRDRRPTLRGA